MLEVRNLSWAGRLNDINLEVRPGEVVGLGGLDGQGQRQLLLALFGTLIGASRHGRDRRQAGEDSTARSAPSRPRSAWR